jgi:hypothetical protein
MRKITLDESALLAKLEQWLAQQSQPVGIFDVLAEEDRELAAAFILKAFRSAARDAVIDRLNREGETSFYSIVTPAENAAVRVFEGLARAWRLEPQEQLALLGVRDVDQYDALAKAPLEEMPVDVLERVSTLLTIFESINTLLSIPERADRWVRQPNTAPLFEGRSALDLMLDRGTAGMRQVRSYLLAQH